MSIIKSFALIMIYIALATAEQDYGGKPMLSSFKLVLYSLNQLL